MPYIGCAMYMVTFVSFFIYFKIYLVLYLLLTMAIYTIEKLDGKDDVF